MSASSPPDVPFPPFSELVPHADPMVLLDEMTAWEPGKATATLRLRAGAAFVQDGVVDTIVSIEYMAQAVAACLGYEAFVGGDGVRVGMIIASRRFDIEQAHMVVGETYTIAVERVRGNESLSHFEARITDDATSALVSSAQLTLFHAEQPPE